MIHLGHSSLCAVSELLRKGLVQVKTGGCVISAYGFYVSCLTPMEPESLLQTFSLYRRQISWKGEAKREGKSK